MYIKEVIDIEQYRDNIEIIKVMLNSLCYLNFTIRECLNRIVSAIVKCYRMESDKNYLKCAIMYIQAYLEMGYSYEDSADLFDYVLGELGTNRKTMFPKKFYLAHQIKLNKSQVRSMIGKWNATNTISITEVVEDIIDKVKNCKEGIYYYRNKTGKTLATEFREEIYELVVSHDECFFHDVKRKKYFTFKQ